MSVLIVIGIGIANISGSSISPLLGVLKEHFNIINNDALLNLSMSIAYPMMIAGSIIGNIIEKKIGTKNLFILYLALLAAGLMTYYAASTYGIFLLGRILFGFGNGMGIPFIGSALMKWYTPKRRELMNSINTLLPFIGALISFGLIVPIYNLLGKSWRNALGIWSIGIIAVGIAWILIVKENKPVTPSKVTTTVKKEKNMYYNLLKRRDIRYLCIAFMCDMFCYAYIAVVLPTFLSESAHWTGATAGLWSAIAFPGFGLLGCMTGGIIISITGQRRPTMAAGQICKFIGIMIATLGASYSVWYIVAGVAFFGIGNSIWMPPMYMVPMELEGMNSTRVGAAFAIIASCGFAAGFISPIIGGWLTNALMNVTSINDPVLKHVFGIKWSMFATGFLNVLSLACVLMVRETGQVLQKLKVEATMD